MQTRKGNPEQSPVQAQPAGRHTRKKGQAKTDKGKHRGFKRGYGRRMG